MGTSLAPGSPSPAPATGGRTRNVARRARPLDASGALQAVLALTLLGGALRFSTLDVQSIWLDESATLLLVHRGFSGMLSHLAASESTPPLYYVLVWAWTKLLGSGPIAFRSFSALAGTLTIPLVYAAGRHVSHRVGLWAAALTVVNPAMYYYSQEARAYALLILFSAAAFVCWQRALERPERRLLALWAAASVLAVLTHYFAAFLFLPEAVLLWRRHGLRKLWVPTGAVVLTGLALLPLAVRQRSDGKASWIEGASLITRAAETVKQFLVGLYGPAEVATAALAGLLAAAAVGVLLRRGEPRERASAAGAGAIAACAIGLPLALAVAHVIDIFDGRNVIAAWVPCVVVVAIGLGAARAPRAVSLLGAGLCAVSLAVIVGTDTGRAYQRDDWRGVAHALPALPAGERRVIVASENSSAPLSIYLGALRGVGHGRVRTSELDFVSLRVRRTGRSAAAAPLPSVAPPGFRAAAVRRTESFAIATFIARAPREVSVAELRRIAADPSAEAILQH